MNKILVSFIFLFIFLSSATAQSPAAEVFDSYSSLLAGKKVGLTANHTSLVKNKHLLDVLLENNIEVKTIFAPEHGFRGEAGAGETISHSKDAKTGLPIISLFGQNKKPSPKQLENIDIMVFDMQDVGVRFYTYLSTLHYLMEACAEANIPLVVLDRPNPNLALIDGPILEPNYRSFVGIHPIPVLHGMTLGELALMINGEAWLKDKVKCKLTVVPCSAYTRSSKYELPVKPSPNLPNMQAIYLYPSLCFFEGTPLSVGRGTDFPFQVLGHPTYKGKKAYSFTFTPLTKDGKIKPVLERKLCYGLDLRTYNVSTIHGINLQWLLDAYKVYGNKPEFFNKMFNLLAGNKTLQEQIKSGKTEKEIQASWKEGLDKFKKQRQKYLLYD